MKSQINYLTNLSSKNLQQFIQKQQDCFVKYCNDVTFKQQCFSIQKYLKKHKKQDNVDSIYYCNSFEEFLVDKYRTSQDQDLFTLTQYFNDFWKYFPYIFNGQKSASIKQYYTHIINYYNQYSRIMKENYIPQTLHNFILWLQINYPTSNFLSKLQNHYFYNIYIHSFIDLLIQVKRLGQHQVSLGEWSKFYEYLNDFQSITTDKHPKTVLSFNQYGPYYIFRKQKEIFVQKLIVSPDISFNRKIIISYLNQCYETGTMPNKKRYIQYQRMKQQEEKQKSRLIAQQIQDLKRSIQHQQKQEFYSYIFQNFIDCLHQYNLPITIEQYYIYKAKFLQQVDLDYVKQQEELIKEYNSMKSQQTIRRQLLSLSMDQTEQQLHREFQKSEQEQQEFKYCDCCNGRPYECQNQQCQQMGCCLLCSFH